jgi:hypothetical protein
MTARLFAIADGLPMTIHQPMSEYEGAIFSALMIVMRTLRHLNADTLALAAEIRKEAALDAAHGLESAAATLEVLAKMAEDDTYQIARPTLSLIQGGKGELTDNPDRGPQP